MIEFKGTYASTASLSNGGYMVSFETDTIIPPKDFGDKELRISCKRWREKKSVAQNAFLWEYITRLAVAVGCSKDEMYTTLLDRYPTLEENLPPILVSMIGKEVEDVLKLLEATDNSADKYSSHWVYLGLHPKNKTVGIFRKTLGVSQMDTKQIATFTDCVLDECRAVGIKIMETRL